jgi:hypothetical protein
LTKLHPGSNGGGRINFEGYQGNVRYFRKGDLIWARSYFGENKLVPSEVIDVLGPRNYTIKTGTGQIWKRHINQLWLRKTVGSDVRQDTDIDTEFSERKRENVDIVPWEWFDWGKQKIQRNE